MQFSFERRKQENCGSDETESELTRHSAEERRATEKQVKFENNDNLSDKSSKSR